jgi:hypothetical protein
MEKKSTTILSVIGIIAILLTLSVLVYSSINQDLTEPPKEKVFIEPEDLDPTSLDLSAITSTQTTPLNQIQTDSSGQKYTTDPSKIRSGGPSKGGIGTDKGIPALAKNNIKYEPITQVDWIRDDELVLFLEHKGEKRIFPLQIMTWHEIANVVIAGDPLAITYCPLCGSGIAYYRVINNDNEPQVAQFGTSGKLFNSNLVMYDDITDTYWQQIGGNAIVGELTGQELRDINIDTVVWRDIKNGHPKALVLSKDTGMNRAYGIDPYASYFENDFLFFPVENEDDRIKPKDFMYGIKIDGIYKAYREEDLKELKTITDTIGSTIIKLERLDDGRISITNLDTNEEIIKERDFWFAWYAFHPETELYQI